MQLRSQTVTARWHRARWLFLAPFRAISRITALQRTKFLLERWKGHVREQYEARDTEGEVEYTAKLLTKVVREWGKTAKQRRILRALGPYAYTWRRGNLLAKSFAGWKRKSKLRPSLNSAVIQKMRKRLQIVIDEWRRVTVRNREVSKFTSKVTERRKKQLSKKVFEGLKRHTLLQFSYWKMYRIMRTWKIATRISIQHGTVKTKKYRRFRLLSVYFCRLRKGVQSGIYLKTVTRFQKTTYFRSWSKAIFTVRDRKRATAAKLSAAATLQVRSLHRKAFLSLVANWDQALTESRGNELSQGFYLRKVRIRLLTNSFQQWKSLPIVVPIQMNLLQRRSRHIRLRKTMNVLIAVRAIAKRKKDSAEAWRRRVLASWVIDGWRKRVWTKSSVVAKAVTHRTTKLISRTFAALMKHSLAQAREHFSTHRSLLLSRCVSHWKKYVTSRNEKSQKANK